MSLLVCLISFSTPVIQSSTLQVHIHVTHIYMYVRTCTCVCVYKYMYMYMYVNFHMAILHVAKLPGRIKHSILLFVCMYMYIHHTVCYIVLHCVIHYLSLCQNALSVLHDLSLTGYHCISNGLTSWALHKA